jgi:5-methylcytosine-specific restriction protein A
MTTAVACLYKGKVISVAEALQIKGQSTSGLPPGIFLCSECQKPVKPHRSGGHADAHFEHLKRNPECSLSHPYSLTAKPGPESIGVGEDWGGDELKAAVEAYIDMQRKHRAGEAFVKKQYYENLSQKFGRSAKAFEYRMQNISYVLSIMGREWLSGLKPAKNVGANVAAEIEALLAQMEGRRSAPVAAFEIQVRDEATKKNRPQPTGNRNPKATSSEVTLFQRDPKVKAWVLQQACGKCESCAQPAPFNGSDGLPYLEVHHVRQLADNGSDTVTNAIALCPNCHRELHYGKNSQVLMDRLYELVNRLVRE